MLSPPAALPSPAELTGYGVQAIAEQKMAADAEPSEGETSAEKARRKEKFMTDVIRTAISIEPREGRLYLFLPPLQ